MLLRLIDIINRSWDLFYTYGRNLKPYLRNTNSDKCHHYLDTLVLLTSVPPETSVLSKYNIVILFVIYTDIHLRKLVDNVCHFYEKQLQQLLSC